MKIRIRKRNDDPHARRWFAYLCGTSVRRWGRGDIVRIFFPWFCVDLLFLTEQNSE